MKLFQSKIRTRFGLPQLSVDGNDRNSDNNNEFYNPTKGIRITEMYLSVN